MEPWITVVVAVVVALSTLGAASIQSWFSNKRFVIELGRAIGVDIRKRKWEVRSESLLKLRAELALMATKLHTLVTNTQLPRNQLVITEKEQQALEDWRDYMTSGEFLPTLYLQYDEELKKRVKGIEGNYLLLFEYALDYKNLEKKGIKRI